MIRKRVLEALAQTHDWKVVDRSRIERADGLVLYTNDKGGVLHIASAEHGVSQGHVELDHEIRDALAAVTDLGMGTDVTRRPALKLLGAEW